MTTKTGTLAIHGGDKAVTCDPRDAFRWPIVTEEDEAAVLEVLRAGKMSGTDITKEFEAEFAAWMGMAHGLAYPNGTDALRPSGQKVPPREGQGKRRDGKKEEDARDALKRAEDARGIAKTAAPAQPAVEHAPQTS